MDHSRYYICINWGHRACLFFHCCKHSSRSFWLREHVWTLATNPDSSFTPIVSTQKIYPRHTEESLKEFVNNAGIAIAKETKEFSAEDFSAIIMGTNFETVFHLCQTCVYLLKGIRKWKSDFLMILYMQSI